MNRKTQTGRGFFSMGVVLLITVLLVLLLITFSLLRLRTAKEDQTHAALLLNRTQQYYAANNQAERTLQAIINGYDPGIPVTKEDGCCSFTVPITEGQCLAVKLDENYRVIMWQIVDE